MSDLIQSPIPGTSTLLEGEPGSGKTHSLLSFRHLHKKLGTIPFELGVISLDKNVRPVLGEWSESTKSDEGVCRIKTITFNTPNVDAFSAFDRMLSDVNMLSNEALQKTPGDAGSYKQMMQVSAACRKFVADDGTDWGNISKWGTNRVLVIDGLTNLTVAAKQVAVGYRPALTLPDYQVIGNVVKEFLRTVLYNVTCHFVLLAHVDREDDEVNRTSRIFPSTLGRKLGPIIGGDFSDVVLAKFHDGKWVWQTQSSEAALKVGNLPIGKDLEPSFANHFLDKDRGWIKRGGVVSTLPAKGSTQVEVKK